MVPIFRNRPPEEGDEKTKETYNLIASCPNCHWVKPIAVYLGNIENAKTRARLEHTGSMEAKSGGGCSGGHNLEFELPKEKEEEKKPKFKFKENKKE